MRISVKKIINAIESCMNSSDELRKSILTYTLSMTSQNPFSYVHIQNLHDSLACFVMLCSLDQIFK